MFVPLPNLDDRRWADLVEEARALIPVYSDTWTDHNASDPGITIIDHLASVTDGSIFRVNRIPDAHKLVFLSLIGVRPGPPVPARTAVQFDLAQAPSLLLPATTELDAVMLDGNAGKFRLLNAVSVLAANLVSLQVMSEGRLRDVTGDWQHRKPIAVFGSNPRPGDALYLGFDAPLAPGDTLSLYIGLQAGGASREGRQAILDELRSRHDACKPWIACGAPPPEQPPATLPDHHSAAIVWEEQTSPGVWKRIAAEDHTRSMTLSGPVVLTIGSMAQRTLRCRFASGALDAAPVALQILDHAAEAEQAAPLWEEWPIAAGVVPIGTPPALGQPAWLRFRLDAQGCLAALEFTTSPAEAVQAVVLAYKPATAMAAGSLTLEAVRLGMGTGAPNQIHRLPQPQVAAPRVYSMESTGPRVWSQVDTFAASGPADTHFFCEASTAEILFGDGQSGRVPPAGASLVAVANVTAASAGNVAPGVIRKLNAGPHNASLFAVASATARLRSIANPDTAHGGADLEPLAHAEGRAALLVDQPRRAVTLADCETLALETPGVSLARAAAIANYCPGMQCYAAPGFITVVIIPFLPAGRPVPSLGLRQAVAAYLNRRRVIGTRIEIVGPDYLEVSVSATVKAGAGENKSALGATIAAHLAKFLDPLHGGPDYNGWPLGRAVYVSEVLETIARVPGVEHVASLALTAAGCDAQCGDICLNPVALAVSGAHRIQVN